MVDVMVDECNRTRRNVETMARIRRKHFDSYPVDGWNDEYGALVQAWAVLYLRLEMLQGYISAECDPWFKVAKGS